MSDESVRDLEGASPRSVRVVGVLVLLAVLAVLLGPRLAMLWNEGIFSFGMLMRVIATAMTSETALLFGPVGLGAIVMILQSKPIVRGLDNLEKPIRAWKNRPRKNFISRFIVGGILYLCVGVYDKSQEIKVKAHRAAVRLTLLLYLFGVMAMLVYMAAVVVVVLFIIGLVFSLLAGGGSGRLTTKSVAVSSHKTQDWLGPKTVHLDAAGNPVGESRPQSDWLGAKTVHWDAAGNPVGESRPQSDWLGAKTVHWDAAGNPVGESRSHENWLGKQEKHEGVTPQELVRGEADPEGRP